MSFFGYEDAKVYHVDEVVYGQLPGSPAMNAYGIQEGIEVSVDPSLLKLRGCGGVDVQSLRPAMKLFDLAITFKLWKTNPFYYLQYIENQTKSCCLEVLSQEGSSYLSFLLKGVKGNKVTVKCAYGEEATFTASFLAQSLVTAVAKQGVTYDEQPGGVGEAFLWPLDFTDMPVKKGTAEISNLHSVEWTLNNNYKRVGVITSTAPDILKAIQKGARELSGVLGVFCQDKSEVDEILADTDFTLRFKLGTAGATNGAWVWNFYGCKWDKASLSVKLSADLPNVISLPWTAKTYLCANEAW